MDVIYIEAFPDVFATFDDFSEADLEVVKPTIAMQRLEDVD